MKPDYVDQLRKDRAQASAYYRSSVETKTEQQKALEALVAALPAPPRQVADIACGAGAASYHLSALLPDARFVLVDRNPDALQLARELLAGRQARLDEGDIYRLGLGQEFDLVICWQTLSWLDRPDAALKELVRILQPGGTLLASSLFNLDFDVDIHATVTDRTRGTDGAASTYSYNTFAQATVARWLDGERCRHRIHRFELPLDIARTGRGLGTFTERLADGRRIQISAGMLMNWGILQVDKLA